jgi:putative addiction module component (TIGR02574 family)
MVQEIWHSIVAEQGSLPTTEAQRAELDRRIASRDMSLNETKSWEETKHGKRPSMGRDQAWEETKDHDHRLDHHVGAASSRDGAHRNLSPVHIAAGSRSYGSSLFRGLLW